MAFSRLPLRILVAVSCLAAMLACEPSRRHVVPQRGAETHTQPQGGPSTDQPAIRIVSPVDGQVFSSGDQPIHIEAALSGVDPEKVAAVKVLSEGKEIATRDAAPFSVALWPGRLGRGTFLLRVTAVMKDGIIRESAPVTIHIAVPAADTEITARELAVDMIGENNVEVRIYRPKTGEEFRAPATIAIKPSVLSTAGNLRVVEITADGQVLAALEHSPFEYVWRDVPRGRYTLVVRATTTAGRTVESPPTTITVK